MKTLVFICTLLVSFHTMAFSLKALSIPKDAGIDNAESKQRIKRGPASADDSLRVDAYTGCFQQRERKIVRSEDPEYLNCTSSHTIRYNSREESGRGILFGLDWRSPKILDH